MTNVIERHKEDMTLIFATVYTLSECSGGELNFDRGEKLNPRNVTGKLESTKILWGNEIFHDSGWSNKL